MTPSFSPRSTWPDLPRAITSFGAAKLNDALYVYGGHLGEAHAYAVEDQSRQLWRLSLSEGDWEVIAEGPPLQGLALVSDGQRLFRVGGFTARNSTGEEQDLWSGNSVATWNSDEDRWDELPPLPEPRSSHDAIVLDNAIYVVGGWSMCGSEPTTWPQTAWKLDLDNPLEWQSLPQPPFSRRALAVAAFDHKLFVIGGMQEHGGPTPEVTIFETSNQTWSEGPPLPGDGEMTGFGPAACGTDHGVYVSTVDGQLLTLNDQQTEWNVLTRSSTNRFFHRLLPVSPSQLALLGGANMQTGKFRQLELIDIKNS